MQNLNDLEKLQQAQKMQAVQQIPNQESAGKPAPSRFSKFTNIVWFIILIFFVIYAISTIVIDDIRTKRQIQANVGAALNSPRMQAYRAQEAKRQREIAQKRRLRQLGIDGVSESMQKNDLLNQQLKKQEIAEREELTESKQQVVDYRSQLAEYNARLKEVQEEEARLRAEAQGDVEQ